MIEAYPLSLPVGFVRTSEPTTSQFKTSLTAALKNVKSSLTRFGNDSNNPIENIVISSNYSLGNERPTDTAVAVWFVWEKKQLCIAVDKYKKIEDNLQAIHHIIEARRTELRHGGLHIVRQTFSGFKSLPPARGRQWYQVLMIPQQATEDEIKKAYRKLSKETHPEAGGSAEEFQIVNEAYNAGLKARGFKQQ